MSAEKRWVISCDMAKCQREFVGDPLGRAARFHRRRSERDAFALGWGMMAIGKFGQKIYLCPECREALRLRGSPKLFCQFIANGDHTADHTVLLECGHEFTKVDSVDGMVDCPACRAVWFKSGEIEGFPSTEELLPHIPED
jgi:Zn-finger nucleic acid-binding protein